MCSMCIGDRPFVIGPLQRGNSFTPLPRMSLAFLVLLKTWIL